MRPFESVRIRQPTARGSASWLPPRFAVAEGTLWCTISLCGRGRERTSHGALGGEGASGSRRCRQVRGKPVPRRRHRRRRTRHLCTRTVPGPQASARREPPQREPPQREPPRQEPPRKDPGRQEPGRQDPNRRQPGRRQPGRRQPGRRQPGQRQRARSGRSLVSQRQCRPRPARNARLVLSRPEPTLTGSRLQQRRQRLAPRSRTPSSRTPSSRTPPPPRLFR